MERIPVVGPWITELEVAYVTDAARNGWYTLKEQQARRRIDRSLRPLRQTIDQIPALAR